MHRIGQKNKVTVYKLIASNSIEEKIQKLQETKKDLAEQILQENPELIVVTAEVGYGLVPVDAFERQYREAVGRICTNLAACADRVDRVQCGIGTRIK